MKWIGQNIYDFVATFRQGVTMDSTLTFDSVSLSAVQTSAESFADNDTSLMTSAAIDDRINTAVTAEDLDLTTDSGTIDVDLNSETLTISGGEGIDTSAAGTTVTIVGEEASTSNKGVASFSSTNFVVSSGAVSLRASRNRTFTKTSDTDGDYDGDVVYFGGTEGMGIGTIYHYKSDGTWEVTNANAVATCDGLLGVALGEESDVNGVLLRGMVTLDHDPGAVGDVLFLSAASNGDATATAPSGSSDIVRVIGYCLDASDGQIWFDPDNTYVEVA